MNWHGRGCKPDVRTFGTSPSPCCVSCGSFAPETLSQDEVLSLLPKAAEDDAAHFQAEMNLRWPSSVVYKSPTKSGEQDAVSDSAVTDEVDSNSPSDTVGTAVVEKAIHAMHQPIVDRQLRLLRLCQGAPGSPLHGYLEVADLQYHPEYEALSYTWADFEGDSSHRGIIHLGDAWHIFPITRNCEAALGRIRSRGGDKLIWVDAICIDQSNNRERTQQVGMMQYIYATAQRVVIYLGDLDIEVGDIEEILKAPYFSRIWVIQEVAAGRHKTVIYGSHEMPWEDFHRATHKRFILMGSTVSRGLAWFDHVDRPRLHSLDDLFRIMHDTSHSEASDRRDMVFAILGLFMGTVSDGLVADYSLSVRDVAVGISAYLLTRTAVAPEAVLCYAMQRQPMVGYPSWALDWSAMRQAEPPKSVNEGTHLQSTYSLPSLGSRLLHGGLVHQPWFTNIMPEQHLSFTKTGEMLISGFRYGTMRNLKRTDGGRRLDGLRHTYYIGDDTGLLSARTMLAMITTRKPVEDSDVLFGLCGMDSLMILRSVPGTSNYSLVCPCSVAYHSDLMNPRSTLGLLSSWDWALWPSTRQPLHKRSLLKDRCTWFDENAWQSLRKVVAALEDLYKQERQAWTRCLLWKAYFVTKMRQSMKGEAMNALSTLEADIAVLRARLRRVFHRESQHFHDSRRDVARKLLPGISEMSDTSLKVDPDVLKLLQRETLETQDLVDEFLHCPVRGDGSLSNLSGVSRDTWCRLLRLVLRLDLRTRIELLKVERDPETRLYRPPAEDERQQWLKTHLPYLACDQAKLHPIFGQSCKTALSPEFDQDYGKKQDQPSKDDLGVVEDMNLTERIREQNELWKAILETIEETKKYALPMENIIMNQFPYIDRWTLLTTSRDAMKDMMEEIVIVSPQQLFRNCP